VLDKTSKENIFGTGLKKLRAIDPSDAEIDARHVPNVHNG
jgi:hypothetical protein